MFRHVVLVLVLLSISGVCLAEEKTKDGFPVVTSEQKLAYPNIAQMIFSDWQEDGLPTSK